MNYLEQKEETLFIHWSGLVLSKICLSFCKDIETRSEENFRKGEVAQD